MKEAGRDKCSGAPGPHTWCPHVSGHDWGPPEHNGARRQDTVVTIQFMYVFFQVDMTSEKSKIFNKINLV